MKTNIRLIGALCAGLLLPFSVLAALSIVADDTVAGLGTNIEVRGLIEKQNTTVTVLPPYGPAIDLSAKADRNGVLSVRLEGSKTHVAGMYTVEVAQQSAAFEVSPQNIDTQASGMEMSAVNIAADGMDETYVSVILRDRYGNTLPGRPVSLISSRSSDTIAPLTSETDASGEQQFAISTTVPGAISLRAMDLLSGKILGAEVELWAGGTMNGIGGTAMRPSYNTYPVYQQQGMQQPQYYAPQQSNNYAGSRMVGSVLGRALYGQVSTGTNNGFDIVDRLMIEAPTIMNVNEDATIRIVAVDRSGNIDESYVNLVYLSSTDPTAFLPLNGEVQFLPQNLGQKALTLGLRFRTPGEHILYAEDSTNPDVNGQVIINVQGESAVDPNIRITSHENNDYVNSTELTLEGEGSPFINIIVMGGSETIRSETDRDGKFSIPLVLNENQTEYNLSVEDETGRFVSGNLHLTLDTEEPEIETITFEPTSPTAEGSASVTIVTEPDLKELTMQLDGETLMIPEKEEGSGMYELTFTAPDADNYQPVILATDRAGNEREVRTTLTVLKRGLPQVQNVVAEARVNAVSLAWDPVTDEDVDGYRIYVGEDPENFLYTLETDRPTAAATVAGLQPGVMYFFSVTALKGDRESSQRSDVVQSSSLGLSLDITEQDGALLIEWANLPQDTPLSTFLLDYGSEPDAYVEQRSLSGDLHAYHLRDLINGVTYYIRLTPVTTTGEVLRDLSTIGRGTPSGGGFTQTPESPVPDGVFSEPRPNIPPIDTVHSSAPIIPRTGLPISIWWLAFAVAGGLLFLHWYRRRTVTATLQFLQNMESRYHNQ